MSPARSGRQPGGPYRKPRPDVYTVLLVLALICLLLGVFCLYFEMDMYEWKLKGGPSVRADPPTAVAVGGHRPGGAGAAQAPADHLRPGPFLDA